ncbi:MAG: PadR family transcriptional regulator [Candidatus Hydrogenedentes bacterium]|nr:PadR family transcriptional regulator [Candidatus Hydrogenedentota bacterium]
MNDPDTFNIDNWSTQLRKGLVEFCILNMLSQQELYGYDLVKRLTAQPGLAIADGSVYPLLSRMRKVGLVVTRLEESPNGPARKYYALTPEGRRCWAMMNAHWDELARGIESLRGNGTQPGAGP